MSRGGKISKSKLISGTTYNPLAMGLSTIDESDLVLISDGSEPPRSVSIREAFSGMGISALEDVIRRNNEKNPKRGYKLSLVKKYPGRAWFNNG